MKIDKDYFFKKKKRKYLPDEGPGIIVEYKTDFEIQIEKITDFIVCPILFPIVFILCLLGLAITVK